MSDEPVRLFTPPLGANAYILENCMIDVGGDTQFLLNKVSEKLKEIEYVFLTHSHFDHASAAADVQKIGSKVIMHKLEYESTRGMGSQFFSVLEPDLLVEGGEVFNCGDYSLEVIHTPGHSRGSICLYERDKKWLFSGDTVFPYGAFGRVDLPGGNPRELIMSLEKLSKLDIDVLYPGHEDPVKDGKAVLNSLRNARSFL